jgi:hypothetical protein
VTAKIDTNGRDLDTDGVWRRRTRYLLIASPVERLPSRRPDDLGVPVLELLDTAHSELDPAALFTVLLATRHLAAPLHDGRRPSQPHVVRLPHGSRLTPAAGAYVRSVHATLMAATELRRCSEADRRTLAQRVDRHIDELPTRPRGVAIPAVVADDERVDAVLGS